MVNKLLLVILLVCSLSACDLMPTKEVISYQQVDKVVYKMVEPPATPKRPELEIERLTTVQMEEPGELAKAFTISTKQLQDHVKVLEELIEGVRKQAKEHNDSLTPSVTPNNLNDK